MKKGSEWTNLARERARSDTVCKHAGIVERAPAQQRVEKKIEALTAKREEALRAKRAAYEAELRENAKEDLDELRDVFDELDGLLED